MTKVAAWYGVSSVLIGHVCGRLKIPCPPLRLLVRLEFGQRPERPPLPQPEAGDEIEWVVIREEHDACRMHYLNRQRSAPPL